MSLMALIRSWVLTAVLACFPLGLSAQVLFDSSLGLPIGQEWLYGGLGPTSEYLSEGCAVFDTTAFMGTQAGYTRPMGELNRTNGFSLSMSLKVTAEAHVRTDRSGFSLILLSDDKRGIELGFWNDHIFAQSDNPLFTHGEDVAFPTTQLTEYALTFHPTNYTLKANGVVILQGPIRDYSAFGSPYSNPNFIFFGDDTTSASASVWIKRMALIQPPVLVALANRSIAWKGVPQESYSVQSSTNLLDWTSEGAVTSLTSDFSYTDHSSQPARFFRVLY